MQPEEHTAAQHTAAQHSAAQCGVVQPSVDQHAISHESAIQEILEAYRARLITEESALVRDRATVEELSRQVASVLEDVFARVATAPDSSMKPIGEAQFLSVEIGANRARRGIHPIESLRASKALFDVALPAIALRFAIDDPPGLLRLSLTLHEAIMERVALGSLSYVNFLTDKLHFSRGEERRRIARELHDRVSHSMALALQHLDLYGYHAQEHPQRARAEIWAAMGSVHDALRTVQQLSAELRRSVGAEGIEKSLRAYLDTHAPGSVRTPLTVTGDAKSLPAEMSEELYLILREACRNALRHAEPTELRVTVAVTAHAVRASVIDDGNGFDPVAVARAPGGGLPSMTERADLLRGTLSVTSEVGRGTTIGIHIPARDRL